MIQIVTTGKEYSDIDGLSCVIAYSELQNLLGRESMPVFTGDVNQSVTESVKKLSFKYNKAIPNGDDFSYALMDISDFNHFPSFVELDKVEVVYDHHFGYEEYWRQKLGESAHIEEIGAAATLVFEDIVMSSKLEGINKSTLLLLYTAIISNSLNLNASVTKDRDREAVRVIRSKSIVPTDWDKNYFNEVSSSIINNPEESMDNDTKMVEVNGKVLHIVQLELWESLEFIQGNLDLILNKLGQMGNGVNFLTSPSISDGKTYLVTVDEDSKETLTRILGVEFKENIGILNKLMLRKEIIREFQNRY